MHNALHNNSSPRSLNPSAIFFTSFQFKSLRYFFHEFPIWRLNRAPRLLRRNVDQKNCQSSIDVTGRSTFLAEEKRRNSSKSITNARQASSRKFRPPWLSPGPRRISMRPVSNSSNRIKMWKIYLFYPRRGGKISNRDLFGNNKRVQLNFKG